MWECKNDQKARRVGPRRRDRGIRGPGGTGWHPADDASPVVMASMEEVLQAIEALDIERPWDAVAASVFPVLRRRRPLPAGIEGPVRRTWPPGLEASFGLDIGPAFMYLGTWHLEHWGISEDELATRALANVRERCDGRRNFGLICEEVDGIPVSLFHSREGWASMLLLLPDLLDQVFGPEPGLILAPMRDVLIQLPVDADHDLARCLLEDFAELDPNALDVPMLLLVDGQLSFLPPDRPIGRPARRH